MFCIECGHEIDGKPKFCPECGTNIGSKTPKAVPSELIESLIGKHFALIAGYGNSPDDRFIVHNAIVNLFNDFSMQMYGTDCFVNFKEVTGDVDCNFSVDFTDEAIELIIELLIQSDKVVPLLKPIVTKFLFWFVYFGLSEVKINCIIAHKIHLTTLEDRLSDSNLGWYGVSPVSEIIINFYKNVLPESKDDFLAAMQSVVSTVESGSIDLIPGLKPLFDSNADRKATWEYVFSLYTEAFTALSVNSILEMTDWLKEYVPYFESKLAAFLDQEFVSLIQCQESVIGNKSPISGKDQILFFSNQGICEIYTKEKHRRGSQPIFYPLSEIHEISIGTEDHESYGGFTSSVSTFMVLTIFTVSHKIYTKHIYMGGNEAELNSARPEMMKKIAEISKLYTIVEGDVIQSSSGFSVSPSIGIWHPID
jgi:hypothetical protein